MSGELCLNEIKFMKEPTFAIQELREYLIVINEKQFRPGILHHTPYTHTFEQPVLPTLLTASGEMDQPSAAYSPAKAELKNTAALPKLRVAQVSTKA